ncbi:MAG TPA: hypothetical protein PLC98_12195 [Anaerolineales bacterium]|nr:hypothetical protein [Anaerolineales bacterium]
MMPRHTTKSATIAVWMAIGTGIGAALMATDLGASGFPIGMAIGLGLYGLRSLWINRTR